LERWWREINLLEEVVEEIISWWRWWREITLEEEDGGRHFPPSLHSVTICTKQKPTLVRWRKVSFRRGGCEDAGVFPLSCTEA